METTIEKNKAESDMAEEAGELANNNKDAKELIVILKKINLNLYQINQTLKLIHLHITMPK